MKIIKHDITTIKEGIIPHGVNCQGVMGSGVALAIRNKWPEVYKSYKSFGKGEDLLGVSHIIRIENSENLFVTNCFTQVYYGSDGRKYASPEAIETALDGVFFFAKMYDLPIHSPQIGCGLGGLNWKSEVKPIYERLAKKYNYYNITIHYL